MTAAPFVAIAETDPRSRRSIRIGDRPVLITCAPRPHTIPRPARCASRIAATTALKSAPASIDGIDPISAPTPPPGRYGDAKSARLALLLREARGYVRTPDRSKSS